jgi:holin-like protein
MSRHRLAALLPLLAGLALLFAFSWAGEALRRATGWPVPGALLGMAGFWGVLRISSALERWIAPGAELLLKHLPLFFLPAAVDLLGVVPGLRAQLLPLLATVLISGVLVLGGTGLCVQGCIALIKRLRQPRDAGSAEGHGHG